MPHRLLRSHRRCITAAFAAYWFGAAFAWGQEPGQIVTSLPVPVSAVVGDPMWVALLELARVSPTGIWIAIAAYLLARKGPFEVRFRVVHEFEEREAAAASKIARTIAEGS
jgi:hypothetical protein